MKGFSRIWFPAALVAAAALTMLCSDLSHASERPEIPSRGESRDTVIYEPNLYRKHMAGDFLEAFADTGLVASILAEDSLAVEDTLPHLTARDTLKAPDSLEFTDPFRYKYYLAIMDSLCHVEFKDSLIAAGDSIDWPVIDSLYTIETELRKQREFEQWYNSLSPEDRKIYDKKQEALAKVALAEEKLRLKEEEKARRDSIIQDTPRILETFAVPDSMQYKQIIQWTTDPDFHKMDISIQDTSYNYHYYDYDFRRNDVNSTWLGVAGSGVQPYNYFKRRSLSGVEFYEAQEAWSYDVSTVLFRNTKTPYTELAYWGTIFSQKSKESDNVHIFTSQNILPALNMTLQYDMHGGGGMLENEETNNKNLVVTSNFLGKKYLMHFGFIHNKVSHGENGGITDNSWIRDTTVDSREIAVALTNATSMTTKNTFFLEQQLRIPFNFIGHQNPDSLNRDITTAFIGHSSEFSVYKRTYEDSGSDSFFSNRFYSATHSADTFAVKKLDNKLFLRLQPWSENAVVSKLNVGIGDQLKLYNTLTPGNNYEAKENTIYGYAGVEGQIGGFADWDAKGRLAFAGHDAGDFLIEANAKFAFNPFRRDRYSPVTVGAHFETALSTPTYFQRHFYSNHYFWKNDFGKSSSMKIQGYVDIPHWQARLDVGYAILGNTVYYDSTGIARQSANAVNVLTAALKKNFTLGILHLDNQVLAQLSSDQEVVPVPALAFNLRWYIQFAVKKDPNMIGRNIMEMQFGLNAFYNTPWHTPGWNPVLGNFYNQTRETYTNGPFFDVFLNVQWKRACIFIKMENLGKGWPLKYGKDYFSADHYIITQPGLPGLKIGVFWPFYTQPFNNKKVQLEN